MLTCGVPRSSTSNCVPPDLRAMYRAVAGRELHQALRAGGRDLAVAEVRLGVDHGGDERGIEALVVGLLADDVLVAQRQRDLAHRVVELRPREDDRHRHQQRRPHARREAPAQHGAPAGGGRGRAGALGRRRVAV